MVRSDGTKDLKSLNGQLSGRTEDYCSGTIGWGVLLSVEFFKEGYEKGKRFSTEFVIVQFVWRY